MSNPVSVPVPSLDARRAAELEGARVAEAVGSSIEAGLSDQEAARRLDAHGKNRLADVEQKGWIATFFEQLKNPILILLMVTAVAAGLVGELRDALGIFVVVLINATLSAVQEGRAQRGLRALKDMLSPSARVRRGGRVVQIPSEHVVPGDVVVFEAGDRIPADSRLVVAADLEVDESALTGESLPVRKQVDPIRDSAALGDRRSLAHMNTVVTRGRGESVVFATGMSTEMGRISRSIDEIERGDSPLSQKLTVLGRRISGVSLVVIAGFAGIGILRDEPLSRILMEAIALAAAAIPEGLPTVVTITLGLGAFRLAKDRAIAKRLDAVEALGSTTVICTDKTGTLTWNEMTVRAVQTLGERFTVTGSGYVEDGAIAGVVDEVHRATLTRMARGGVLCNDAELHGGKVVGDPTEGAFLVFARKAGVETDATRAACPRVAEIPFDADRRFMATFHDDDGDVRVWVKGAVESIRDLIADPDKPLDAEETALADEGLRVLAIATGRIERAVFDDARARGALFDLLTGLELLGLLGLLDPLRDEAKAAVDLCHRAAIRVLMLTGDHPHTAAAIARELGLKGKTVSGVELESMKDDELKGRIVDIGVFARVAPEHKLRIVRALQDLGEVVAMTGDGVNDAPALHAADIGVAMGKGGTEVAREAAAMVLTDDNFATIVTAVERGRAIYDNIVKFVRFQLTTAVAAVLTVFFAPLLGLPAALNPIQILWINVIMDGPPALALGLDPPSDDTMRRPPRRPGESILPYARLLRVVLLAMFMAGGTLGLLSTLLARGVDEDTARTVSFTVFVLFQVFGALLARVESRTVLQAATFKNPLLGGAFALVVLIHLAVVHIPLLQGVFRTVDLDLELYGLATAVAASVVIVDEVLRPLWRRMNPE